jgi:hypothetical protein
MKTKHSQQSNVEQLDLFGGAKIDRRKKPYRWWDTQAGNPLHVENRALAEQGLKRCKGCETVKPLSEFYPMRTAQSVGRVQPLCKVCALLEARYRFTKRLYGITAEQYRELFVAQQFSCAICGQPGKSPDTMVRSGKRGQSGVLVVDHDHSTGDVRGLLCSPCNQGLGSFRDDRQLLQKAIAYLTRRPPIRELH